MTRPSGDRYIFTVNTLYSQPLMTVTDRYPTVRSLPMRLIQTHSLSARRRRAKILRCIRLRRRRRAPVRTLGHARLSVATAHRPRLAPAALRHGRCAWKRSRRPQLLRCAIMSMRSHGHVGACEHAADDPASESIAATVSSSGQSAVERSAGGVPRVRMPPRVEICGSDTAPRWPKSYGSSSAP